MATEAAVDACFSLVRKSLIEPGTPDDACCLVLDGMLYSVWAVEDPGYWQSDANRRRGQVTSQGGFPQQKIGKVYIVGVDKGAYHEWPTLPAGPCRWCRGTGVHPHLSERWQQVLHAGWPLGVYSLGTIRLYSFTAPAHAQITSRTIDPRDPGFRQSWRSRPLTSMLESFQKQGIDLLANLGLPFEDAACPRCAGHGGTIGVSAQGSVAECPAELNVAA